MRWGQLDPIAGLRTQRQRMAYNIQGQQRRSTTRESYGFPDFAFPFQHPSTYPSLFAMRLYTVVVLATAFLLGGSVTSALQPGQIALSETESVGAALQHDSAAKRSLRIRESTEDYQDEDDEEEDVDEEEEEEERGG